MINRTESPLDGISGGINARRDLCRQSARALMMRDRASSAARWRSIATFSSSAAWRASSARRATFSRSRRALSSNAASCSSRRARSRARSAATNRSFAKNGETRGRSWAITWSVSERALVGADAGAAGPWCRERTVSDGEEGDRDDGTPVNAEARGGCSATNATNGNVVACNFCAAAKSCEDTGAEQG
ncbi:hypothetical protein BC834DRAFT_383816 [Gloeopeniophorella convolvens]|nr:hypothetical protein BC834DRAFT_383816 [Gloeopeniophorella convolvens]